VTKQDLPNIVQDYVSKNQMAVMERKLLMEVYAMPVDIENEIGDPGVTEFRQEQLRAAKIIRESIAQDPSQVVCEYEIHNLKPVDFNKINYCCPDIFDKLSKTVYRVMGKIHEKKIPRQKDEIQKEVLEGNGYKVIDFWYYDMPNLFARNRTSKRNRLASREVIEKIRSV